MFSRVACNADDKPRAQAKRVDFRTIHLRRQIAKFETQNPKPRSSPRIFSNLDIRISDFLRISRFVFRIYSPTPFPLTPSTHASYTTTR
jgi:hypothetical protein